MRYYAGSSGNYYPAFKNNQNIMEYSNSQMVNQGEQKVFRLILDEDTLEQGVLTIYMCGCKGAECELSHDCLNENATDEIINTKMINLEIVG
jgi:hypothetical protein